MRNTANVNVTSQRYFSPVKCHGRRFSWCHAWIFDTRSLMDDDKETAMTMMTERRRWWRQYSIAEVAVAVALVVLHRKIPSALITKRRWWGSQRPWYWYTRQNERSKRTKSVYRVDAYLEMIGWSKLHHQTLPINLLPTNIHICSLNPSTPYPTQALK